MKLKKSIHNGFKSPVILLLPFFLGFKSCKSLPADTQSRGLQATTPQAPGSRYVTKNTPTGERAIADRAVGIGLQPGQQHPVYRSDRPFCSGLIVELGGANHVLTAAHCLKDAANYPIGVWTRYESDLPPVLQREFHRITKSLLIDHRLDMALVDADLPKGMKGLALAVKQPSIGDRVFGIGHPAGDFKKIADACKVVTLGVPYIFTHNCQMTTGNSGTAILDEEDQAVFGVLSAGRDFVSGGSEIGSEIAVNLGFAAEMLTAAANGELPVGYRLDTPHAVHYFLRFNAELHCPRSGAPGCNEAADEAVAFLSRQDISSRLASLIPGGFNTLKFPENLGLIVRLRASGQDTHRVGLLDFVFMNPTEKFDAAFERWFKDRRALEEKFKKASRPPAQLCAVGDTVKDCEAKII